MLTRACLPYLRSSVTYAQFLGAIPFYWDSATCTLKLTQSLDRWTLWLINVGLQFSYFIFIIARLCQRWNQTETEFKLIHVFWLMTYLSGVVTQISLLAGYRIILASINAQILFERRIHRENSHLRLDRHDFQPLICNTLLLQQLLGPWILPLLFILFPHSPQFISSLVVTRYGSSFFIFTACYLLEVLLMSIIFGSGYFLSLSEILCAKGLTSYLKVLRSGYQASPCGIFHQSQNQNVRLYRQIQVLSTLYNEAHGSLQIPFIQVAGSGVAISSLYGTLTLWGIVQMPAYLAFPLVFISAIMLLTYILDIAGKTLGHSRKVLASWRRSEVNGNNLWLMKVSKSCYPVALRARGFFIIKPDRAAMVIRFCLQRTFFLIVYLNLKT